MLQTQSAGMNGRLEEISPWLKFSTSDWTTPNGSGATQGWERVPYWLRGYIDLGYCLQDAGVMSNATRWIQGVLTSQRTNGYFGPAALFSVTNDASFNGAPDMWPHMPMLDAFRSYYDVTGDTNALALMRNYAQWQNGLPAANFGAGYWPKVRMGDNIDSVYWLYNRTGDAWLLDLAGKMYTNMARWDSTGTLPNWHNVNIAEGFRAPAVYWQQSGTASHLGFAEANYQTVMSRYGQVPGGAFGADENCRTGYYDPRQGFETCGMVEFMRSFEILTRVTGNPVWAERCEDVALNSFPVALRTNQLALHYLTAPNQVQLDRFNKSPSVQNGGTMFSYSPFEVYHCCQHNHGQGWPYFCDEAWLATWDNGLCASLYAATTARARVGDGSTITVTEVTDYPFSDIVQLSIAATNTVQFPLYLRIPQWCSNAWVQINGQTVATNPTPRSYLRILRPWANGDQVALCLPKTVTIRTWTANKNSVSANYGPLTFSLQIGELWQSYGSNPSWPEWEAYPKSAWNFGLSLNPTNPAASFTVVTNPGPLPAYPFSPEAAPIRLLAKARQISEWTLDTLGCVSPLQASPAYTTQAEQTVTLVPMGASRLRVSAFPTVSTNPAAAAWSAGYSPSASYCNSSDSVQALCDGLTPASSADTSIPRMTWWNHLGTAEWLQADFGSLRRVSQVSVYWFDDTGFGQCRVPQSWSVEYLSGTNWVAVSGAGAYGAARDVWNTVDFTPVQTTALRLRVQLQPGVSGGVLEWRTPAQSVASVSSRYPLDGNLNDVESGQNGTLAGGSFVPDRHGSAGGALQLDGVSQYATIPRQVQLNWTISFWVRTTAAGGTGQWFNGKGLVDGEVGGVTHDFGTALVGSKAAFGVGNPDTTILSTTSINDGRWHHIAATRDGFSGQMQLFVDGQLQASTFGPTGAKASPPALRLGCLQTGINFLAGALDDVRIVDRVMSAAEVAVLANDAGTSGWMVVRPSLNTNELIVAAATPQQYGAKGDGVTDDSAAFQTAMNTVYSSGGGVIFVPAGSYAFYTNLSIPAGVTLHGDWADWTQSGGGAAGTIFKVFAGAGQTNSAPFIFLNGSTALKGVTIWHPNQQPAAITGYPFTIGLYGDCVVQNVILVNSYQGIQVTAPTSGGKHILSTVIGSPLYKGVDLDMIADISHAEDIRFSPAVWPASLLPGAPAPGGPHAAWMRANGTAMRLQRVDGEACMDLAFDGYKIGIESSRSTNGVCGATFYSGSVSNCAIAVLAQEMAGQSGLQFARFNLDGDVCVYRTSSEAATVQFHSCQLAGRNGIAVQLTGGWQSWMQFQNCVIFGTLQLDGGVFDVVNSSLRTALGADHCVMGAGATRAAFIGCDFNPSRSMSNAGDSRRLIIDGRRPISNPLPVVNWSNIKQDYLSRQPARTNLYVVTLPAWGAVGDGVTDDTAAIQSALAAAGAAGGGIVFLPGGKYRLSNTLTVPAGVELRGTYELRHRTWPGPDGRAKGSVLQPYAGQGTVGGPVAIALGPGSGLVGVTISYEAQGTNATPYPPTIQGRGPNVYVIGVVCPNPYWYVDLETYPCANHLLYMVDGWALRAGFRVSNGSSGSIVDCHGNWTYWWDNYDSASVLGSSSRPPVLNFAEHNLEMFVFGDCSELLVKNFVIPGHTFTRCISQDGRGPNITCIGGMADQVSEGFRLDAAAPCSLNAVNSTLAVFADYPDLDTNTVGVISSPAFQGTARFFNTALFGGPNCDFLVGGGDVGFEAVHQLDHSAVGARVDGGVLHLINNRAYITYRGTNVFPVYNVAFSPAAGLAGKVSEVIGCYAYNGVSIANASPNNPVLAWGNFPLATLVPTTPYDVPPPRLLLLAGETQQSFNLGWPGDVGAFDLCCATNLASPVLWTVEGSTPVFAGNQWSVTITNASNGPRFYRLQQ